MKKIYLLIILLVSGSGFAQAPVLGSYEVIFNGWAYGDEHHNCGAAYVNLEFSTPTDNKRAMGITYSDNRATTYYTSDQTRTTFTADKKPVSMFFSASRYDRQSCRGNRPHNSGRIYSSDKFHCFDYDFQFKQFKNVESSGDGLGSSFFNVKVRPLLVIINPGPANELPTEKLITISSHIGFFESEYNWQYSFTPDDPDSWVDMPQFSGKPSFTTNAKGILGENAGEHHGKTISFKQIACNAASAPVHYIIRQSAPEIISKKEEKTKCFDTQDGKLILQFSRPLFAGEKITFSIRDFDEEKQVWKEVMCSTQDGDQITLDATNSYEFPCNFPKGKYGIAFSGFINGSNTGSPHTDLDPYIFNIESPAPVDFTLASTNVNCFGSADGTLTINASGGTEEGYQYSLDSGANWIPFTDTKSKTEILAGLFPATKPSITYTVKVRDKNGCIALIDDKDKVLSETISEPLAPLALTYTLTEDPTFFGASNGIIVAAITGGTLYDDNTYWYEWKNSEGDKMPVDAEYNPTEKTYYLTLKNVPAGNYKLTVRDKNYGIEANKIACSIVEDSKDLTEPKKIVVTLNIDKEISCNSANLEESEGSVKPSSSDAKLIAKIEGGKKLDPKENNGIPYYFHWKMLNAEGEWDDLKELKDSIASGLPKGTYSLNITDANEISQGTYSNYEQLTEVPTEILISEPAAMKVVFQSGNVSCFGGENGWANAAIQNGKSTYSYKWYLPNNVIIKKNEILDLKKGRYYIEVVDNVKGCFVRDSIEIKEPATKLALKYLETTPPTFTGASNGKIVAEISGGTSNNGTYNYVWKNKAGDVQITTAEVKDDKYIITLDGIPADTYVLTVTDKNYDDTNNQIVNCSLIDSLVLTEPKPLKVTFEKKVISCNAGNEFGNSKDTEPKDGQRDESQDGILTAHVTGGVTLKATQNNGLPYFYTWKKQKPDGSWENLVIQDSIAPNLSHGNYAFNIEDRNGIVLGTYANNQLSEKIDEIQFMEQPSQLSVTITQGNVFCYGGNDGWAEAHAVGGTAPYTYEWSNEVKDKKNTVLKKGEYWLIVTDDRGCTTQESVTIIEPPAPLTINYKEVLNPSFYKATNGKIVVEVTGGTIASDNSYWFEWKNSKGIVQTTTAASFSNGIYTISLNGIPEETYSLTVRDANYDAATNKVGCTVANSIMSLDDPEPLEVTLEIVRTISCNAGNDFGNETDANPQDNQRDEAQDGILKAYVKGGIQLKANQNNGLPYYYTWKKQQKDGSWIIWNDQDETAENLSDGTYALNIEDANGIKLGTYTNNVLVKETDVTQLMAEPAKLKLTFTKFDVGCTTGDDGWAEAHVSGGTAPYTYEWTNGKTIPKIENITTNNYFVLVKDAKGCVVQGSIFVGDPNGVFTTETVKNPTCYKGNDGVIQLNVTGGNLPYTYAWNTGAKTKDLNNITAGNYEVTITCPDCCVYKKKFVLKDPEPVIVAIGPDRTLCNDQNLDLDASIADPKAQYNWTSTNGFTSNEAKINVSKAGTYKVKVTSGLGCIGEDEIIIKTSQAAISSEFLLSSQAYLDEEVILINTSNPYGEGTNWIIPEGVKIVEQKEKYITLKFDAVGVYTIGLQQTQGECYAIYNKNITVEQRSTLPNTGTASQFIVDFIVTPNPSNGNFKALINLENESAVNLRLFSTTGQNTMIQKKESGKKKYEIDFETSLGSGMYILVLETGQQTLVKKIIIY